MVWYTEIDVYLDSMVCFFCFFFFWHTTNIKWIFQETFCKCPRSLVKEGCLKIKRASQELHPVSLDSLKLWKIEFKKTKTGIRLFRKWTYIWLTSWAHIWNIVFIILRYCESLWIISADLSNLCATSFAQNLGLIWFCFSTTALPKDFTLHKKRSFPLKISSFFVQI